ncbi:MAG: glucuronate isomerase [Acidobacteria bacterium]|nr:glucuronate isomerase [Acidobacteriota bacterium]
MTERAALRRCVEEVVDQTPVIDIHTHLYAPEFEGLNLYGIDELLTYHYLVAEMFRYADVRPEQFWSLTKKERAALVWRTLFVENTPLSEASIGVLTVLNALGIDPNTTDLEEIRRFFEAQEPVAHVGRIFEIAGVGDVVMTNDPLDPQETKIWDRQLPPNSRFHAALRMDRILNDWAAAARAISEAGFAVDPELSAESICETRRFLDRWIAKMKPLYMAVSLPDDFGYFADDARNRLIREVVLPTAAEHGLPFALMVGVRRGVNPALRAAGDGVGRADVKSLEKLCAENPGVRFLATFLARENQHELCVSARKFSNLMPFGCWWFLNNPSIVGEITRERIELLGTSFIPQHSDARVLEQLIYKWRHSRRIIAEALAENYEKLLGSGRFVTKKEIERDVAQLFAGNFQKCIKPLTNEIAAENNG